MKHDPHDTRREQTLYLDALPPPDAAFLKAARAAVVRAGILPWDEFKTRWDEGHRPPPQHGPVHE